MADGWKATFARLGNGNYQTWKFRVQSLLEREELWDQVENLKPEETDEGYADWKKKDVKARATISLLVEDSQLRFIKKCETARDMWRNLKAYHEKATIGNQVTLLQQVCSKNLLEGGNVEQHLEEFEDLFERLDNAGVELSELLRIIMMLRSLPPSYSSFVTALENRPQEDLTLDLVTARLRDEYQKRSGSGDIAEVGRVFQVSTKNKEKPKVVCYNCGKAGHMKRNCRLLNRTQKFEKQDSAKVVSDEGPLAWTAYIGLSGNWYVDSGASRHMTSDCTFFETKDSCAEKNVTLADGSKAQIDGVGSGTLVCVSSDGDQSVIKVSDVLYVPTLESGLISVNCLVKKGMQVVFEDKHCLIKKGNQVIAVANKHGSLYKLCIGENALVRERLRISLEQNNELEDELQQYKSGVLSNQFDAKDTLKNGEGEEMIDYSAKTHELQTIIVKKTAELSQWQRRVSDLNTKINKMEDNMCKLQEECTKSQEEYVKMQRDLRENVAQKEDQEERIATLEKRYLNAHRELSSLQDLNEKLEQELRHKEAQLKLQEGKIAAIQEKLELSEQKLTQFSRLPEMEEQLKVRMETLTQAQERHGSAEDRITRLENNVEKNAEVRLKMNDEHNQRLSSTIDKLLAKSNDRLQVHLKERMTALQNLIGWKQKE